MNMKPQASYMLVMTEVMMDTQKMSDKDLLIEIEEDILLYEANPEIQEGHTEGIGR